MEINRLSLYTCAIAQPPSRSGKRNLVFGQDISPFILLPVARLFANYRKPAFNNPSIFFTAEFGEKFCSVF